MKPAAEQLRDPKWWDENAPKDATHYVVGSCSPWEKLEKNGMLHHFIGGKWYVLPRSCWGIVDGVERPGHPVDATDMVARSKYHHLIAVVVMPDGSKHEVWVDVYDVIKAWGVTNPAQQHLIKKALQSGDRGHKDYDQDMDDIIASAERAKQLNAPTR